MADSPVELGNWAAPARDFRSVGIKPSPVAEPETSSTLFCCPEIISDIFAQREIKAPIVFVWLAVHLVSLLAAMKLYYEINSNMQYHDKLIQDHCRQAEHLIYGACVSEAWKLAFYDEVPIQSQGSRDYTFTFKTTSHPPTFILVRISRHADPQRAPETFYRPRNFGVHSIMVLDESTESGDPKKPITWDGLVIDTQPFHAHSMDDFTYHVTKPQGHLKIYVEDADIPHLEIVRSHPVCSVPKSWHALSDHAIGEEHVHLATSRYLVGISCWITLISCVLVWRWFGGSSGPRGSSTNFAWLVGIKSLLHDLPLQVLISTILISALSNQILFKPKVNIRGNPDDDELMRFGVRIIAASVTTLPFTTAMVIFNSSMVGSTGLMHLIFAVPCAIGWASLFTMLCYPMMITIEYLDENF
ncbi:hypothetical protein FOL47_005460 [Perkinsus chesapeaki]|uniref:Uncharacterized protein n=1 Tax=Perkinsus chesapeaki TaxID=330153 RepID=A0A7J6LXG1_PERCH|nr:hypothetical protein FOL47_005460 [Perkinsus chesapeaki]